MLFLVLCPTVAAFSAVYSSASIPKSSLRMSPVLADTQPKYINGVQVPQSYIPAPGNDSIKKFENDMAKILAARNGTDMTLPEEYRRKRSTRFTYTKLWTHETWEAYNSRWRYVRSMVSFPKSRLLRMISPQLFGLMAWAAIVSYGAPAAVMKYPLFNRFSVFKLPLTPLSLISGFVAGLLTLRTNNALTRLFTGRQTWGRIMSLNRDLAQQIATYVYPYDEQLGLLCARHLAIFGMLTKTRFRDEKDNDITDAALSPVDAAYVQSQRKKAPACIQRIRQVIASMAGKGIVGPTPQLLMEQGLSEMNQLYTVCEGILSSPIPPLYTSNNSRILVFYLLFLPVALHLLNMLSPIATILTTGVSGFAMLGMDEITHQIEQPFRVIPMQPLSNRILQDVADAFVCETPKLPGTDGKEFHTKKPAYW